MQTYLSGQQVSYTGVAVEGLVDSTSTAMEETITRTLVSFRISVNLSTTPSPSVQLSTAVGVLLETSQFGSARIIRGTLGLRVFTPSGQPATSIVLVCV